MPNRKKLVHDGFYTHLGHIAAIAAVGVGSVALASLLGIKLTTLPTAISTQSVMATQAQSGGACGCTL